MAALSATALRTIRGAGFTREEWVWMWGYTGGVWGGDRCGCQDDRCIGHHHDGADGCGCLGQMINDAVAWRTATRRPNSVELAGGPWGLNQWVDVSTPHVLATVSTSQHYAGPAVNGVVRERPAETSVRIRPRDGWSAVAGEEEWCGERMLVIRFAKITAEEVPGGDPGPLIA